MGTRILIIKLAAMGDVLRTTTILLGLKAKYPQSNITWLTEENVSSLLKNNNYIDRLLVFNNESLLRLQVESFDVLICLDKEPKATALAMLASAKEKLGFGLSPEGSVFPLNPEAYYNFMLGISDNLKFKENRKTYQELIYETARLSYDQKYEYVFPDLSEEIRHARAFLNDMGLSDGGLTVGLNTGSGPVFATKKWTIEGYSALASSLMKKLNAKVLLLGGPHETERNKAIERIAKGVINTGNSHTLRFFSGIVGCCDLIVTGDTLALHIAIGLKKKVLLIIGSTCHQEIELYGRGEKIVSNFDCAPCYKSTCNKVPNCMDNITAEQVFDVAKKILARAL